MGGCVTSAKDDAFYGELSTSDQTAWSSLIDKAIHDDDKRLPANTGRDSRKHLLMKKVRAGLGELDGMFSRIAAEGQRRIVFPQDARRFSTTVGLPADAPIAYPYYILLHLLLAEVDGLDSVSPNRIRDTAAIHEQVLSLEAWRLGWVKLWIFSRASLLERVRLLRSEYDRLDLSSGKYLSFLRFVFFFQQKIDGQLPKDVAVELWSATLTNKWGLCDHWVVFVRKAWPKSCITQDQWCHLPNFAVSFPSTAALMSYDEASHWPSMMDAFAVYVKNNS